MNIVKIIQYFESKYPKDLAYEWDNVGLQVGTLNVKVKKVLVSLDLTKDVVKEAIELKTNMILTHHPLMFAPMNRISFDSPKGWIIKNLIKHNITVYSAHTNYDLAEGGMNDVLAKALKINSPQMLDLQDEIGRFGSIDEVDFDVFIKNIKESLKLDTVKVIGRTDKTIKTIGVSGGSGSKHMYEAKKAGCDVYLTGDVTYHTALDAIALGLTIIDIGHHAEKIFVPSVVKELKNQFPEVDFIESKVNSNPFISY
ncbi:MAG: Nif3-like dinuclear metal center hexameric protein [Tenericutes bacterium]|jgi:dinuclear metal center YbgI/SA1388 family protein|nr:Nif3-like dinuclear metal center hexameric protein [Mycoplasmatota bacterium]